MNDFKQNILKKIKNGELDMRPHWHFVLKGLLMLVGIIVVALCVIYLLSFILFTLKQTGVGFAPLYGFKGLGMFVLSSPWLLIVFAAVFLVLLYILVSKYSFSYQRPLIYSMLGVVLLVLVSSFVIGQTSAHRSLQQFAEHNNVPGLAPLYRGVTNDRPENITPGIITELNTDGFVIQSDRNNKFTVVVSERTKKRRGVTYDVGDVVFVFGEKSGETIRAIGIRPAPRDFEVRRPVLERSQSERIFTPKDERLSI